MILYVCGVRFEMRREEKRKVREEDRERERVLRYLL